MESTHMRSEGCWVTDGHWQDELWRTDSLDIWPNRTHTHTYRCTWMQSDKQTHTGAERKKGHRVTDWAAGGADQSVNTLHWGKHTFPLISIWQTWNLTSCNTFLSHVQEPLSLSHLPWVLGTLSLGSHSDITFINIQIVPESERWAEADRQRDTWTRTQSVHSLAITRRLWARTHHQQLKNGWDSLWDKSREHITSYNSFYQGSADTLLL